MRYLWPAVLVVLCVCGSPSAEGKDKKKPKPKPKPAPAAPLAVNAPTPTAPPDAIASKIKLEVVVRKLKKPLLVTFAPGDPATRLFIIEQPGRIRILDAGKLLDKSFLDVSALVSTGNEQGLLGLAFHPAYAQNGRFFINYTDVDGDTHIVEYAASADPNVAASKPVREWLKVDQPYANHNGGNLAFGPDGKLWVGMGDGGSAKDPHGNGQNDQALLAKMLRLDVDSAAADAGTPQIMMKGMRNPWRWAFDAKTGDLYIGDVGQDKYEEVDVLAAAEAQKGGLNLGWNVMEGLHCFADPACKSTGLTLPVVEYPHADGTGCSVTGGRVYRGAALPELDGIYFYSDFCTGMVRSFRWSAGKLTDHWDWKAALDPDHKLAALSSYGVDSAGELYLISLDGIVYRFVRR